MDPFEYVQCIIKGLWSGVSCDVMSVWNDIILAMALIPFSI